ncbi:CDP-alcohol phosphatidyltransferase family protein [Nocardioides mangrovicus]|uniref:CDP-alcohol phosphatidyltransferase family protein n=1 Tax=Nocardioides mangrovicus TaxID=2478913 RepID=UPI0018E0B9E1|nr:CDP-alcohol phosphatidyltransferase family protein [Nocardioides mangrovicus]
MQLSRRIHADPARERVWTEATMVTVVRTIVCVGLAGAAAYQRELWLLVVALVVHWVGDSIDGWWARVRDCETRTGATLDILSDRFDLAAFYIGLGWLLPHLMPAIGLYLAEFLVVDCFISLAFLFWPITSPNYFYVVDRTIWRYNWSKPAKAVNSALFGVLLLVTRDQAWGVWLGGAIALALLVYKCVALGQVMRLGLPMPTASLPNERELVDDSTHSLG